MSERQSLVVKHSDVKSFSRADGGSFHLAEGHVHELGPVSIGISDNPPGTKPVMHRHSCQEIFVVYEGRGRYIVGDTTVIAEPGDLVVVPPDTWHSFGPEGDSPLRHVAVFGADHVDIDVMPTAQD
jgi:mannose-6-phosphate isomerase-like protein (cupin superfamily)